MTSDPPPPADSRRPPRNRSRWMVSVLLVLLIGALAATAMLSARTLNAYRVLDSAHQLDAPDVGTLRAWMTLGYVADSFSADRSALLEALRLPPTTRPATTLRDLADREGVSSLAYVQRVQRALVAVGAPELDPEAGMRDRWFAGLGDRFLSAVLIYGYPLLGLTLVLGAVGFPLPTGLTVSLAGSLISQDVMSWPVALVVAVAASTAGDVIGYRIGWTVSGDVLEKRGRWIGYTRKRRLKAERFFARWGGLAVFLSRTLMSAISPAMNVIAGASGYRFHRFLLYTIAGRIVWTGAYAALGHAIASNPAAASGFLTSLSLLLLAVATAVLAAALLVREARIAGRNRPQASAVSGAGGT